MSERDVPWLIFDGDCSFCTTSAGWIGDRLHRAAGPNVRLIAWQFVDLEALGTNAERAQREVLWVAPDGTVLGGAPALAVWLRYRGGLYAVPGVIMDAPALRTVAAAVYRLVARNRDKMPGGSPACALPPPGFDPTQPGTKAL